MNAKSPRSYPAVIIASVFGVLGLVGVLLLWFQVSITVEPIGSDTAVLPGKAAIAPPAGTDATSGATTTPASTRASQSAESTVAQTNPQPPAAIAPVPGALRVSNQSEQPLRVALLTKQPETNSTADKDKYSEPIHWDFAPGEGSSQGLLLSLPQGNLKLKKGDVIVAFAEDGSRRYWGPYVVGETPTPILDRKTSEWQLVLEP